MTPDEYLAWIIPAAKSSCEFYGLPWQVVVAQGAIESQWGKYGIGNGGFNLFGRKWGGWGNYTEEETEEVYDGERQTITAKFQSYDSLEQAINDWCELMEWGDYKPFSDQFKIDGDLNAFVSGVASIYATDPEYASKILDTIKACDL